MPLPVLRSTLRSLLAGSVLFLRGDWKRGRLTGDAAVAEEVTEEILIEEGVRS